MTTIASLNGPVTVQNGFGGPSRTAAEIAQIDEAKNAGIAAIETAVAETAASPDGDLYAAIQAGIASVEAQEESSVAIVQTTPGFDTLYPNAYASALPRGVMSGTIGGTAITGATPGTYALTAVGGSITGVEANLVVTSSTAASIVIVNPGLGTGTTPPTWANPGGATIPGGTTLTAVVAPRVATTGRYLALSADGLSLQLYQNDGTSTPAAVSGVSIPTASYVSSIADLFDTATGTNLYDPSVGRDNYVIQGSGLPAALTRYGEIGLVPVTAGESYTISCKWGSGWVLNQTAFVNFYNSTTTASGATLIDSSTAGENGVTFSDSGKTVCFTAPTGAVAVGLNLYSSTIAVPTSGDFDTIRAATMMNTGLTAGDYQPYIVAGTKKFPDEVVNPSGPVTVALSGTDLYVRQNLWNSTTRDTIRKLTVNQTPTTALAGTVDIVGQVFTNRSYDTDLTVYAYNGGSAVWASTDNGPPLKYNAMYLGGGHGLAGAYTATKTAHGLTNTAVGDVGTDGSGVSWVLTKIVDANTIQVVSANTSGDLDKWTINGTLAATGTITFAVAGAFAYTARTSIQVWPAVQSLVNEIMLNDVTPIAADGFYNGDSVTVRERYGIPNPARWLALLISERGTATPKELYDAAVATQVYIDQSWRFDRFGAMVGYNNTLFAQTANLPTTGSYSYVGTWQHQTIFKTSHTLWQYVPDLATTVGGYDLKAGADITSNAATVTVLKSHSTDTADPPSHFAQYVKLSGTPVYGLAMGYLRTKGAGIPATRAGNTNMWQLSTSEKQYPVAWDGTRYASSNIPAGTMLSTALWDMAYDMAAYPTHTVDAVYEDGGKVYRVIDIHATVSFYSVPMPAELVGMPVTVISKSSSLTLHTDQFVPSGGLLVSTTGDWGRLIVQVG